MALQNIELWVSGGSLEAPYYRFYTDYLGNQEVVELKLDTRNEYTFRRLNEEESHPFYISYQGDNEDFIGEVTISGGGSASEGITGKEFLKVGFGDSTYALELEELRYYCTTHSSMQGEIELSNTYKIYATKQAISDEVYESDRSIFANKIESISSIREGEILHITFPNKHLNSNGIRYTSFGINGISADDIVLESKNGIQYLGESRGDGRVVVGGTAAVPDHVQIDTNGFTTISFLIKDDGIEEELETIELKLYHTDSFTTTYGDPIYIDVVDSTSLSVLPPAPSKPDLKPSSDSGSSNSDNLTNVTNPVISGSATPNAKVDIFANGKRLARTSADSDGNWSLTVPASEPLVSDSYTITATETNGTSSSLGTIRSTPIPKVQERRTHKEFLNGGAFAVLKEDGSVVTWGNSDNGGDSSTVSGLLNEGVSQIFSNRSAFAALKDDGSVVTWGNTNHEVDSRQVADKLNSGVVQIFSTFSSFAALRDDGSVVTWGRTDTGGDSSSVKNELQSGVVQIFSLGGAFAALKDDGSVITWGDYNNGGDSSSVINDLNSGVKQIFSTNNAFAALKEDGSVITWGSSDRGGDSSSVYSDLQSGVVQIFATSFAFAALKDDGSVITWGHYNNGGDSSSIINDLKSGVKQIFSTDNAFAALKEDGSVITWGSSDRGGDSSSVYSDLQSGVVQIFSNESAFAALKGDGSVATWGHSYFGGDSSTVSNQLQSGVSEIFSSQLAFAALKDDGSVVTWGIDYSGGDSSNVKSKLSSGVTKIFKTERAFAALKDDGSVVTWGASNTGGDSENVADDLLSGVVSFADPFHDDWLTFKENPSSESSPALELIIDDIAPTITISSNDFMLTVGETSAITFTLSETSTNFDFSDVKLQGGNLSDFAGSGTTYTATFNPDTNSTTEAVISVGTAAFTDEAGNSNSTDTSLTMLVNTDITPPIISISSDDSMLTVGETATITFTLSEESTTFDSSDVKSHGGVLSDFAGSGSTYTATFKPDSYSTTDGIVLVAVGTFTDEAGNPNATDASFSMEVDTSAVDTTSPTIVISSDNYSLSKSKAIPVTFTLSENSNDFTAQDVTTTGGSISDFNGEDKSYSATFFPTDLSIEKGVISVGAGLFRDKAGNHNKATGELVFMSYSIDPGLTSELSDLSDSGFSNADNITSEVSPVFSGTAKPGSSIEIFLDEGSLGVTDANHDSEWSFVSELPLADATYKLQAIATQPGPVLLQRTAMPKSYHGRSNQEAQALHSFAALKDSGSIVAWGQGISSLNSEINFGVSQLFANNVAYAALRNDGSVFTFGNRSGGGDSSEVSEQLVSGVIKIFSTSYAFAALKDDGSVVTWGNDYGGGNSSSVSRELSANIIDIVPSSGHFAALNDSGSVILWGGSSDGKYNESYQYGDIRNKISSDVSRVFSTSSAFAALKKDGSVVTWGSTEINRGGDSSSVEHLIQGGVLNIFSTESAFAALKQDGSVISWGQSGQSDTSSVRAELSAGVVNIYATTGSFAALKDDGSVITWGNSTYGGDSSSVNSRLTSGVIDIIPNNVAFAALKDDGSVVTWGRSKHGGDSSSVSNLIDSDVIEVFSSGYAFAALKIDGSVVTWGDSEWGGDSSSVKSQLSSGVTAIYSNSTAFSALKGDGSVVTWGKSSDGGDSSTVAEELKEGVVSFADPFSNDRLTLTDTISSGLSTALELTIDTMAPFINTEAIATSIAHQSGSYQHVYTAKAIDANDIQYSLDSNSSALSIDKETGDVLLVDNPDYYRQDRYTFTVFASDIAGNTSESVVSLNIEPPPGLHLDLPSDLNTDENGASVAINFQLNTKPSADVRLVFTLSQDAEASLSHQEFTFTPKNWDISQTLVVTGLDDFEVDWDQGYTLTIQSNSEDSQYHSSASKGLLQDTVLRLVNLDDNEDAGSDFYGDRDLDLMDTIFGSEGPDRIYGERADDVLYGRENSDLIYGGYGDDQLYGDEGDDDLFGEKDNDTLNGGSGNDRLTGGEGYDLLIGGPGDDTYIIDDERDTIDDQGLHTDIDTVIFRANLTTYTVPDSIKNARLDSASAFKLIGNANANTLIGNDIDNDIDGGDGDDSLDGGGGDDTLKGGNGRDAVIYGKQMPGFMLDGSGAQDITVNLLSGTATGSEIGSDSLIAIEDVLTGDGNDHLTGDDQDNRLDAGGGNDTISSGGGNDSIYGGNGDDRIDGGDGSDTAHYTGNFSDYEVTATSNGFTITDTRAFHDGTDDVIGIEIFSFSDQSLVASQLLSSDTTNNDTGGFGFTSGEIISTGSAATQDVLIGDINNSGTHDVSDAISVLRHIVGLEEDLAEFPGVEPIALMDVDSNGQVGVSDAIFILRTIVGLEQLDALVQISVG